VGILDRVGRFIDDVLLLPEDLRELLERGRAALAGGDPAGAAAHFERVLEERPGLVDAALGLGLARERLGDAAAARRVVDAARELDPDEPRLALAAARLALGAGDDAAAVAAAQVAAARLAGRGEAGEAPLLEALLVWGRAEVRRGRPDRGARELRKAVALAPRDPVLRTELVEALAGAGAARAASSAARALEVPQVAPALAGRIGEALAQLGAGAEATPWLERSAAESVGARAALAVLAARSGELAIAEDWAREAVAAGGGEEALALLGRVHLAQGRGEEAAEAFRAAGRESDALRALPWSARDRVRGSLDGAAEDEPRAALLRAETALTGGRPEEALAALDEWSHATASAALSASIAPAGVHPGAVVSPLAEGIPTPEPGPLSVALAAALGVDRSVAEEMRREALRLRFRPPGGEGVDLPSAIEAVVALAEEAGLDALGRAARGLRDDLDRPLLLAILGEFNAGKSTFVNAFVGAEVAPTGILPTTGTLNLLRAGGARRVRVVHRDGSTLETGWEGLSALLRGATAPAGAASSGGAGTSTPPVDRVEIFLPSERLEQVWILDSPGTNALDPTHEALAREAIRRADAALWLFDAGQAGKATEARLLGELLDSRRWVLPVLNKVDRLPDDEAVAQVREVLRSLLGGRAPDPVALSARGALQARLASAQEGVSGPVVEGGEPSPPGREPESPGDALARSGWPVLIDRLEEEVFARSRQLKERATAGRLLRALDETLEALRAEEATAAHRLRTLAEGRARWPAVADGLRERASDALRRLDAEEEHALREAARELLAFARPRPGRFGRGGRVDPEDRVFLGEVLAGLLGRGIEETATALIDEVGAEVAAAGEGWLPPAEARALVEGALRPVFAGWAGYRRGLVDGGRLEAFLAAAVRGQALDQAGVSSALPQLRADPRRGLAPALEDALDALVRQLEHRQGAVLARELEAHRARKQRAGAPLEALRGALADIPDRASEQEY